jgi:predicted small integral membrane protein
MIILIPKIILMLGLSCYLTIAVINNILDKDTNRFLLGQMFSMTLLENDPVFGKGLLSRAIHSKKTSEILLCIISIFQIVISAMLWYGSIQLIFAFLHHSFHLTYAIHCCTIALSCFMSLWFFFWCGGLWFGYWIKTGQVQEVHMRLVIISVISLLFINIGAI